MTRKENKTDQTVSLQRDYEVNIDGKVYRIAPDQRQPGGRDRRSKAYRVLGSVYRAARDLRERDADRD